MSFNKEREKVVLLNFQALGDNIVFLPVAEYVAKCFPDRSITILTSEIAKDIYDPAIFKTIVIRSRTQRDLQYWKKPLSLLPLFRNVVVENPETIICCQGQSRAAHLATLTSFAKHKIGGYHEKLAPLPPLPFSVTLNHSENIALQQWHLTGLLSRAFNRELPPVLPPPPNLTHLIDHTSELKDYVLLHPGASQPYKRWPLENFYSLAKLLSNVIDVLLVEESGTFQIPFKSKRIHPLKIKSLRQLVSVTNGASLFVGNNSGPMHIASALGVTSFVFTGPTAATWDPFWNRSRTYLVHQASLPCLRCEPLLSPFTTCSNLLHPSACMRMTTPEYVYEHALTALGGAIPYDTNIRQTASI